MSMPAQHAVIPAKVFAVLRTVGMPMRAPAITDTLHPYLAGVTRRNAIRVMRRWLDCAVIRQQLVRIGSNHYDLPGSTASLRKPSAMQRQSGPPETVDEFLARGGAIERLPLHASANPLRHVPKQHPFAAPFARRHQ